MPHARSISPSSTPLHTGLWQEAPRDAHWQIIAALGGGLALDAVWGWPGQVAADLWVLAVFAWLWREGGDLEKRAMLVCLVIASLGEAFLSLAWGLYDYQFNNIPLFVPLGHALLMTLGIIGARHAPGWAVWLVPAAAVPYVAAGWWQGWDTLGALLFLIFLVCLLKGKASSLYVTMFVLSLLLELYGTALGNWTWRPLVPWLHWSNTNPPLCSGAFYCVLDLLVLAGMKAGMRNAAANA
ncbi:MAG: hypothetical protein ACREX0_11215 [Noviherbaspirillum sp.]